MDQRLDILVVEDNPGHASFIQKNLRRFGFENDIILFEDGEQILDFLMQKGNE